MLSIRDCAEKLRMNRKDTLEYLEMLNRKHGGLLYRNEGERTKYKVDPDVFYRLVRDRLNLAKPEDVADLHRRVDEAEATAARALAEIAEFRKRAESWFRRGR